MTTRGRSTGGDGTSTRTFALLGVLVVVALYVLVWRPQASQLGEAKDRRAAVESALSDARAELSAASVEVAGLAEDASADAALRAVPPSPELAALLRSLDALAVGAGFRLDTIAPGAPDLDPITGATSVQVTVTGQGSRDAVYGYLAGLRSMERLVVVEQVDLLDAPSPDGDDGAPVVQVQLGLRTFVAVSGIEPDAGAEQAGATTPAD